MHFSEELSSILSNIDEDDVPSKDILVFINLRIICQQNKKKTLKRIKFDNKILHRSRLLKYFMEDDYSR